MSFDHPYVLSAFAVLFIWIIFDFFGRINKYKRNLPKDISKKISASVALFRVSLALAIIAAAGPRWGIGFTAWEYRRGIDVVFAIDVSRSMDIRDAQRGSVQTRLERGLAIAKESAANAAGARFAAAVGRGRGFLAVPLTWDSEAPLSFLESIDGGAMTGRSTNLEALIDAATDAFQKTSAAQKVIVLISDGESHAGVLKNAANRCAREGIIVNTVAVGSDEGRPVITEEFFQDSAPPQAPVSRRDSAAMRMAAERTGGIYIDASREDASGVLTAHLLSLAREMEPGRGRSEPKERRTFFIILTLLFYGASKFVPRLPRFRRPALVSMIAVLFLFSCSEGKILLMEANYLNSRGRYDEAVIPYMKALEHKDSRPYAEYGLGLTFYSIDEGKAALKRFSASQKMLENFSPGEHSELRYRNSYNSGVVFFEEGDFQSAAEAFKDALKIDPRRIEAKRNLELSLISITRRIEDDNRSETRQDNGTREVLFGYLKQNEQKYWKSREWAPEEKFTGPDY